MSTKALDDLSVTHIGADDRLIINDKDELAKRFLQRDPVPTPCSHQTQDCVTVDIANERFDDILHCLNYLGRPIKLAHDTERELHKLFYLSDCLEVKTFHKRDPLYLGGENRLVAKENISRGTPLVIERGFTFAISAGPTAIGCAVLMDKEFSDELPRLNKYDYCRSPLVNVSDTEWSEAMGRGVMHGSVIGHSMQGELPTKNAVFRWFTMLNHSCKPNACYSFDGDGDVYVFALRALEAGEEITVQYTMTNGHESEFDDPPMEEGDEDDELASYRWSCDCGQSGKEREERYCHGILFAKQCISRYGADLKRQRRQMDSQLHKR